MDYSKGFRKKPFVSLTLPAPTINSPVKVATITHQNSSSWVDLVVDLGAMSASLTKVSDSSDLSSDVAIDSDFQQYSFTSGHTYVIYLLHLPSCGSSGLFKGDLQVDRVSTNNTATSFKTFGSTSSGFDPHVGSTHWYQRYKGTVSTTSTLSHYAIVNSNANIFRQSTNQNDVGVSTTSQTIGGDTGGTGSSGTGLTTNRAGVNNGYYVYSETSGSSTQMLCTRYFLHQLPGLLTLGGTANQKFGVSLGMHGIHMGTVNVYVNRNS